MAHVPQAQHADAVRRQLIDLVRSQGPTLLDDGRRVRAMLADAVAGATAEANLIALAIASGVPARLREAGGEIAYVPEAELYHFERQSIRDHGGYARTSACNYNRHLHHTRWAASIEALMARLPAPSAARAAA